VAGPTANVAQGHGGCGAEHLYREGKLIAPTRRGQGRRGDENRYSGSTPRRLGLDTGLLLLHEQRVNCHWNGKNDERGNEKPGQWAAHSKSWYHYYRTNARTSPPPPFRKPSRSGTGPASLLPKRWILRTRRFIFVSYRAADRRNLTAWR
jgi:hypothetical protein